MIDIWIIFLNEEEIYLKENKIEIDFFNDHFNRINIKEGIGLFPLVRLIVVIVIDESSFKAMKKFDSRSRFKTEWN